MGRPTQDLGSRPFNPSGHPLKLSCASPQLRILTGKPHGAATVELHLFEQALVALVIGGGALGHVVEVDI